MAAKVIKELHGFSGNQILLMKKHDQLFVRKTGDILRNVERMYALKDQYPLPKIYGYSKNKFDMEYIHGLDVKTFLSTHHYDRLLDFLISILDSFAQGASVKDYSPVYREKLKQINFDAFPFTAEELFDKLPKLLPCSEYHGDMTLENILYDHHRGFLLIDCQTTEYDSYIFDIAKMRQDLECGWFIRNNTVTLGAKTKHIQQELFKRYPESNNNYLLILMLLRVYRYTQPNTSEQTFIIEEIKKLWK